MVGRRTVPTLTVAAILGAIAIVGCIEHTITGPGGSSGAAFAAHLVVQGGNSQLGPVSQALPLPVTVKVTDNGGLAVTGATVTFSVRQGGGSVSTSSTVSGATGVASTVWTMGSQLGPQQLIAFLNGSIVLDSTVFTATATAAGGGGGGVTPAQIVLVSGNGQSGNVGAQLGANVVVKVVDASGVPVSGTTITWAVAAGNAGGSVSPISSLTDGSGQASTIWLLGSKIGLQTLTAKSVAVPADTLQLIATANLGSSGAVLINSGNNQTGPTGSLLAGKVIAKVVDQNNNAVVGARVTWTVATGGGSLTQTPNVGGITNGSGLDTASWTLGSTVGTQTVTAAVSGVGSVAFSATATTVGGTAATIRIISGSGQVGRSQQVLPNPLVVEVRDASGNTLSGITVTFRQDSIKNKAGFTSPTPVTTGSNGQASVTWTLGANNSNTTVPMAVYASPVGVPAAVDTFTATARPEYRIVRITTPFLQFDTTGATIGASGDYSAAPGPLHDGTRDTLRVQVYDPTDSSGVQGVSITWATQAPSGVDGHLLNATTVTDNFGYAKTLWVLRDDAGNAIPPSNIAKRVFATASVGQVEFQASVSPGRVCSVGQKDTTSVAVGTILADSIRVLDCNGFPVPSAIVTNVASAGGTVSASTDTTDQNGVVRLTWTTSGTLGVQTMTATARKKADPYNAVGDPTFSASMIRTQTVVAGPANSVVLSGAKPASPQAAGSIVPITVIVTDSYGNLVSGQTVTFVANNTGGIPGTVSSASVTTGSGGTAAISWTLGNAGTNTLSVSAGAAAPLILTVTVP